MTKEEVLRKRLKEAEAQVKTLLLELTAKNDEIATMGDELADVKSDLSTILSLYRKSRLAERSTVTAVGAKDLMKTLRAMAVGEEKSWPRDKYRHLYIDLCRLHKSGTSKYELIKDKEGCTVKRIV